MCSMCGLDANERGASGGAGDAVRRWLSEADPGADQGNVSHDEDDDAQHRDAICAPKAQGGRVIAVGTTSCRTLESFAAEDGTLKPASGWTDIFIYPGYRFRCVDALVTNFHLPESTLIMLVSALAGREHVLNAYETAVKEKYRFFSFGDAMLIQ